MAPPPPPEAALASGWTLEVVDRRHGCSFPWGWKNESTRCRRNLRRGRCACPAGTPLASRAAYRSRHRSGVSRALIALSGTGLARASVPRFRDSLSSFFAWAVRERMVLIHPVTATRVPKATTPRTEMYPFSEEELEELYGRAVQRDQRLADLLRIDAWTGLRWSELRALHVFSTSSKFRCLSWSCSGPSLKGVQVKGTKSGRSRAGSVADRVLPLVRSLPLAASRRSPLRHLASSRAPCTSQGTHALASADSTCSKPVKAPRAGGPLDEDRPLKMT